jgi:outer membrane protein
MNCWKYRRIFLSIAILALIVAWSSVQAAEDELEKLTLNESIALALENNPSLKIVQSAKEQARWKVNQARSYKGITLDYDYTRGRTNEAPSWYNNTTINYPVSFYPGTKKEIEYPAWTETYGVYRHQIQLVYPLYTGGKVENTINMAKHGEQIADFAVVAARQQLTAEVTTAYFRVLQARNLADVANQAVDDLSTHLKIVQNHYDVGTVALSDLLQTEVRLANARNNLIKAQNAFSLSCYNLNNVIGQPLHSKAVLTENFEFEQYKPSVDECIVTALDKRPEIAQVKLRAEVARDHRKIAESGNLPTVALLANKTWQDTYPSTAKETSFWQVGAFVKFNVFDNGLTKSEIKQAENEMAGVKEQIEQTKDKVTLDVCQAYLNVQEASGRIENNKVAVNQSETDYKITQERYENGVGTNLDVMDAELHMTQAKINYIQALYDYHIGRAQLDRAMGTIQ